MTAYPKLDIRTVVKEFDAWREAKEHEDISNLCFALLSGLNNNKMPKKERSVSRTKKLEAENEKAHGLVETD